MQKAFIYAGVNVGAFVPVSERMGLATKGRPWGNGAGTEFLGVAFGAQRGYSYNILPRLNLSLEAGIRQATVFTNLSGHPQLNSIWREDKGMSLFYFPTTVGLQYRLHR